MAENPIKYSDLIIPDDSIEKLVAQLEQLEQQVLLLPVLQQLVPLEQPL